VKLDSVGQTLQFECARLQCTRRSDVDGADDYRTYQKTIEVEPDGYDGFTYTFELASYDGGEFELEDYSYSDVMGNKYLELNQELAYLHLKVVPDSFAEGHYRRSHHLAGPVTVGRIA
jgi:hypothetical protein